MINIILVVIQLAVTSVVGIYFFKQLRKEKKPSQDKRAGGGKEMEKLQKMRAVRLSEPLSERVRPATFADIIGQQDGIKALKILLNGPNPQHVLIYGPPGVGKTCAARLALEVAKLSRETPFLPDAPFIEVDATAVRFDERSIADPLLGSVHDPIYQGAGPLGVAGVPQPKPGAVSKAHGGVLFLDEIGELHPTQMNKLLKVLEDRKVMFDSAYYNPDDTAVPKYIHEIFKKGMPADFRLVGATTRGPENIPPALRSRCMEIYFRALEPAEISQIAKGAAVRAGFRMEEEQCALIGKYAACGRDAVNIVQMAAGLAQSEDRFVITSEDIEWVADSSHYSPRPDQIAQRDNQVGCVHGLAVYGASQGAVMEIEAVTMLGTGKVTVTGIVDEEELGGEGHRMRRKSTARGSAENVATLLRRMGYASTVTDLHINFPGGAPVDGPSAGVAMAVAACSALTGVAADGTTAMTGEVSVRGEIKPVGGVPAKIEAAERAGLSRVLIPRANWQERFRDMGIDVVPVDRLETALNMMLGLSDVKAAHENKILPMEPLVAKGMD
ncbi:MAG: ATP-dependent protease LonB [Oscillospiraceae bacterium]|jgi:Lon-like ATP-dependent protease|nr:ATP-dependent protease LonB [Oscillospiraceae bacterium]